MKKIEEITLFYEISNALNEHLELKKALYKVLSIISEALGMEHVTITILKEKSDEINIELAHGMSKSAIKKGKYKLGEGITGKVIQTGKPFTVEKISEEPLFLNRTSARSDDSDYSFICVPIKTGKNVIGALSSDKPFDEGFSLVSGTQILSVVATMIAK